MKVTGARLVELTPLIPNSLRSNCRYPNLIFRLCIAASVLATDHQHNCSIFAELWQSQYLTKARERDEKVARVGRRVRCLWQAEEKKKEMRSIQV